jgi:hypothetical protein
MMIAFNLQEFKIDRVIVCSVHRDDEKLGCSDVGDVEVEQVDADSSFRPGSMSSAHCYLQPYTKRLSSVNAA